MASLSEARAAKAKAKKLFKGDNVNGIGLARVGDGFGIKVNVTEGAAGFGENAVHEVDGVPVLFAHVGRIEERNV